MPNFHSPTALLLPAAILCLLSPLLSDEPTFRGVPLPKDGYVKALEEFRVVTKEKEGLEVTVAVIPDLFLYRMAQGLEEVRRSGYEGVALEKELRKIHAEAKKEKERIGLQLHLLDNAFRSHFFLQKKPVSHVNVKGGGRKSGPASTGKPVPVFFKWTIIAGPSISRRKLALFRELRFEVTVKLKKEKDGAREPLRIIIGDLLCYRDIERKSPYDTKGINVEVKQISLGTTKDLRLEPMEIMIYPGKWKLPDPPAGFDELLETLESSR